MGCGERRRREKARSKVLPSLESYVKGFAFSFPYNIKPQMSFKEGNELFPVLLKLIVYSFRVCYYTHFIDLVWQRLGYLCILLTANSQ